MARSGDVAPGGLAAPVPTPPDAADPDRFAQAIGEIDALNSHDPTTATHRAVTLPKELLHAQLMSAWLERLSPDAGELAHLAARAHHFQRWTRPRHDYPEGRAGYLRWRAAAKRAHAEAVGVVLTSVGYSDAEVARVGAIVRKEGLGADPVVQVHEDALCLVFLSTQLSDTADKVGDQQMVEILQRTLPKMSQEGLAVAAELDLGARGAALLASAVDAAPS